ncbi:hypothetical protein [Serratia marcescens]|uniref:hypothetical protein n=1 Tax=Serratia marcescens TaxID=615 RepID=UPI00217A9D89|nr:hypothetical protein [Serratia marcescens]CAI1071399.1 Uncharacterised protein [Serratia marcescens]
MTKILCSAEAYGYGPCSKLMTIMRHLSKMGSTYSFWGEGIALSYAKLNLCKSGKILESIQIENIDDQNVDAVISVMDWKIAAWGFYHNKPVLLFDSLYWLWEWDSSALHNIDTVLQTARTSHSFPEFIAFIGSLSIDLRHYATHRMATQSFVQHFPGTKRTDNANELINPEQIAPIVDLQFMKFTPKDTILISFSGLANPFLTHENALCYIKLVNKIVRPALELLKYNKTPLKVICAVKEEFAEEVSAIFPGETRTLTNEAFLQTLNRSICVLTPPGITTIYECIGYQVPVITLPEQHNHHIRNYLSLSNFFDDQTHLREAYPEFLINYLYTLPETGDPQIDTQTLYDVYKSLLNNHHKENLKILQKRFSSLMRHLVMASVRRKLLNEQKKILSKNKLPSYQEVLSRYFPSLSCSCNTQNNISKHQLNSEKKHPIIHIYILDEKIPESIFDKQLKVKHISLPITENKICKDTTNYLIYNKRDEKEIHKHHLFKEVICYEDCLQEINEQIDFICHSKLAYYDYHYLFNAISHAKRNAVNLIIGNSYSRNGIPSGCFAQCTVNLSVSSQDFYYSFKIARQILDVNTKIQRCYIGVGYFSLWHDLSKSENEYEQERIESIYVPLLDDAHNGTITDQSDEPPVISKLNKMLNTKRQLFNTSKLFHMHSKQIYLSNGKRYFNSNITRESFSFTGPYIKLETLSEHEKQRLGHERANKHAKMIRYNDTYNENIELLRAFIHNLNGKGIIAYIINFPTSSYYNKHTNSNYKDVFYKTINKLKENYTFYLIDLNDERYDFQDEDFIDVDHLSEAGAMKVSHILMKWS